MIDQLLGAKMPMSADTQKETFQMIIEDTLGEDGDYETVRNIHETLNDMIEEHKEEPDPLTLDKTDVKKIFEQSGVPNEKMENFEKNFEENAGEKATLLASNIAETRKFNTGCCDQSKSGQNGSCRDKNDRRKTVPCDSCG